MQIVGGHKMQLSQLGKIATLIKDHLLIAQLVENRTIPSSIYCAKLSVSIFNIFLHFLVYYTNNQQMAK